MLIPPPLSGILKPRRESRGAYYETVSRFVPDETMLHTRTYPTRATRAIHRRVAALAAGPYKKVISESRE